MITCIGYECCLSISVYIWTLSYTDHFVESCALLLTISLYLWGSQVVERLIETGDSEKILQKAIQEQGRGQVYTLFT